ncbi:hypothetical protein AVEN_112907-1 [Araneus ventricosus]|uniref:HTH CENPB-type domain-containing protein n=1 Tax=Araneus ventricosus TaxID=182803 RepID=A0A4Y2LWT4_ARAVE|nr:hypothetical protein AVEN_112907-1 [Araneus ventricosus]
MGKSKFDEIEEVLVRWLKHARSQNVPISALILKEKAIEIAEELNIEDFGGSNGWMERFKGRHCLSIKTICGEAAAVEGKAIEDGKNSGLKDILSRFGASNVYILDETGLFDRILRVKSALLEKQANNACVSNCFRHAGFIANAESEEILSEDIIDPEPLGTLLQISNEKGCCVNDNAFVNIDNDIAIFSQATVKALTSEFLEEKQNSSGEDSGVENMDQTPPNKTETIEALEKVRQYLTSIQGITDEEFKALSALEKKVTISSN